MIERDRAADHLTIAIDGPAAAGKSTVASEVARRINGLYFDTGIIYRALALAALRVGIDPADANRLAELASRLDVRLAAPSQDDGRLTDVWLDGTDVTWDVRSPEVDRSVSQVSAHQAVRAALLELQRRIGRSGRVVMAGRDIGTVVMPDADLKIWLEASLSERARRRVRDLERQGASCDLDDVRAQLAERDRLDSARAVAPMIPAADAVVIDTDDRTIESVVEQIIDLVDQLAGRSGE